MTTAHILRNVFPEIHQTLALTTVGTTVRKMNVTIHVTTQNKGAVANNTATTVRTCKYSVRYVIILLHIVNTSFYYIGRTI